MRTHSLCADLVRMGGRRQRLHSSVLAGLVVAGLSGTPAHALQMIEARDGVAVEAILSIKEPTRIRIEGAPITDVFGNIHSSNCGGTAAATTGAAISTQVVFLSRPGATIRYRKPSYWNRSRY